MSHSFGTLITEACTRGPPPDPGLLALLERVTTACKVVADITAQGSLRTSTGKSVGINAQGEQQQLLDVLANEILISGCPEGGQLCGMVSEEMEKPHRIPSSCSRGHYLLLFDPLDGSSNIDINMDVGTIFSVLRAPERVADATIEDFLQPGTNQVAAGYALYGPATMLVVTLGAGVHGFTLDRQSDAFVLTHPNLRIPETTREFAINVSNQRFWEPPVRHYIEECLEGESGLRGIDFNMRWIASLVAEVHRVLVRGGIFMYPRDCKDPSRPGRLRLMYEANPMAMIVEQAGGLASTGRQNILDVKPESLHQRIPVILGSKLEVQRLTSYHEAFDRGEDAKFETPLFHARSLFRTA